MERVLSAMNDSFGYRVDQVYRCVDTRNPADPRKPNENHHLLVELLRRGARLVTTNQDCCVELAAADQTTVERAVEPDDASRRWNYLKLHGSIDVPGSLDVVLERTSRLAEWKQALLEDAFSRTVVFLGYGGWDLDILAFLRNASIDRVIWYEFGRSLANPHVREILGRGGRRADDAWLINGDGESYGRLFHEILGLKPCPVPGSDHSSLWVQAVRDAVSENTDIPARHRALGAAFMTAWQGTSALRALTEIPRLRSYDRRARIDVLLDRARAAEQIHDKEQQRRSLAAARRLLQVALPRADHLQLQVKFLLRSVEYHHSFDERRHVRIAYRMLGRIEAAIDELSQIAADHPRLPYYCRLLTYYQAEIGYKHGRFANDREILNRAATAGRHFVESHPEDLETLTDALLVYSRILHLLGDYDAAREQATMGLRVGKQVSKPHSVNAAHKLLGRYALAAGDTPAALHHFSAALQLAEASSDPFMRMRDYLSLALYYEQAGSSAERDRYLDEARQIWINGHTAALADAEQSFVHYWRSLVQTYRPV